MENPCPASPPSTSSSRPSRRSPPCRVDRRTKDLARRLVPGEIAVIDHLDLDTVATEALLAAGVRAVVNAAACISGRYPNPGPLLLPAAGIPVVDGVGPMVMSSLVDGDVLTIDGDRILRDGEVVAVGTRQGTASFGSVLEHARRNMGDELQRFAENTLSYLRTEGHLLLDDPVIPDIPVEFRGRQVLLVVRGVDYKQDLQLLRRSGYLKEQRPCSSGSTVAPTPSWTSASGPT
ncbi:MAG: putative cytokinetic ring protein SteA [Acidimicrobiales bacterium]